ncbi:homeobox protein ceh-37 [Elysia marginata]|uniref:Homeobox protein ceh-37 n=1 Tax=Elysia marginata TaxID=1093978 RepID=A0AAV4IRJ2_9GAST|nr:homeobox protein ceh-37 [Elysia marginata]
MCPNYTKDYGNQPVNGATNGHQVRGDKAQALPSIPGASLIRPSSIPQGNGLGAMWGSSFPSSQQQGQQLQHQQQQQQPQTNNQHQASGVTHNSDEEDDDYRPFTPPPPRERLSYTRYQLELLNGIYLEVRYPNSTQKQLIAKRVGITREQVKIWFQNRRRKDVVTKAGNGRPEDKTKNANSAVSPTPSSGNENSNPPTEVKASASEVDPAQRVSSDSSESCGGRGTQNQPTSTSVSTSDSTSTDSHLNMVMVSPVVLRSIIAELNKFDNEYLKLKKSKKKKNKSKAAKLKASLAASLPTSATQSAMGGLPSCKSQRLFQSYDMVAPPNKITPTAFLNTSANRFKHADGTSAFQTPREFRSLSGVSATDSRLWEGFGGLTAQHPNSTLQASLESSDLLHPQRSPAAADLVHASLASNFNMPSPSSHQSALGNYLAGMGPATPGQPAQPVYENLPVLSDLLSSYKSPASSTAAMAAAAAAAQRQLVEQSYLSSPHPSLYSHQQQSLSASAQQDQHSLFHIQAGSTGGSIGSSNSSINSSLDSGKSPLDGASSSLSSPSPHNPFSLHAHHQASHFTLNRVFPFPLIAEPPMVLSNIRQNDSIRQHTQWPSGPSSPLRSPAPAVGGSSLITPYQGSPTSSGLVNDPYRPLMISSLSNPYFCPPPVSSSSSFTSLLPAPPLWPSQLPNQSDATNQQTYSSMYNKSDV